MKCGMVRILGDLTSLPGILLLSTCAAAGCARSVPTPDNVVVETQDDGLVVPGSPAVDARIISPDVETLQVLVIGPDGVERPMSILQRSIEPTEEGGLPTWTIVQAYESDSGSGVDTSVVRRADLAPLRYTFRGDGQVQRFEFHGARVTGTIQPSDTTAQEVAYELAEVPFNAVVDIDVVRALPLGLGFKAEIIGYNPPWPPRSGPTEVRVTGSQRLPTAEGEIDAWIVAYDAGAAPTTIWIAKKDRRFLRLRSELPDGSVFWKLPVSDLDAWRAEMDG